MRHRASSFIPQVALSRGSQGPIVEQYLAEEALGLVKSLGWSVLKGPFWNPNVKIAMPVAKSGTHLFVEGKT